MALNMVLVRWGEQLQRLEVQAGDRNYITRGVRELDDGFQEQETPTNHRTVTLEKQNMIRKYYSI